MQHLADLLYIIWSLGLGLGLEKESVVHITATFK